MGLYDYETDTVPQDIYYRKTERIARQLNIVDFQVMTILFRGLLYLRTQRYVESAHCARRMLELSCGNPQNRFWAHLLLMRTYSRMHAQAAVYEFARKLEEDTISLAMPPLALAYYHTAAEDNIVCGRMVEALGFSEQALALADEHKISATIWWQLNLQRAIILVSLGRYDEAKAYVDNCSEYISVVHPHCTDGYYSRYHLLLLQAQIAIAENDYDKAQTLLAHTHIPSVMFERVSFAEMYYALREKICDATRQYSCASQMLVNRYHTHRLARIEYARMRTKDIEVALREDTTIVKQKQLLLSEEQDVLNIETRFLLGGLLFIVIVVLLSVILYSRIRSRHVRLQSQRFRINKILRQKINEQTEESRRHNMTILSRNEDILAGQSYAHRMLRGILPNLTNLKYFGIKNAFSIRNDMGCSNVSFYWYKQLADHKILICTGSNDSSSVSGTLLSMICFTLLNDVVSVLDANCTPSEILEDVESRLSVTFPPQEQIYAIEMSVVIVDIDKHELSLSSLGQKNVLISQGLVSEIPYTDRLIGAVDVGQASRPTDYFYHYQSGDNLFLLSSSVFKCKNANSGHVLDLPTFSAMIERVCHLPIVLHRDALLNELLLWKDNRSLNDDIQIIGIAL